MENNVTMPGAFPGKNSGILLSPAEAEEFCAYKRQKRISEVLSALTRAELSAGQGISPAELKKISDAASRVNAAAVRVGPLYVAALKGMPGFRAAVDCIVGGTGETLAKVKAYEAKLAVRAGAGEITPRSERRASEKRQDGGRAPRDQAGQPQGETGDRQGARGQIDDRGGDAAHRADGVGVRREVPFGALFPPIAAD